MERSHDVKFGAQYFGDSPPFNWGGNLFVGPFFLMPYKIYNQHFNAGKTATIMTATETDLLHQLVEIGGGLFGQKNMGRLRAGDLFLGLSLKAEAMIPLSENPTKTAKLAEVDDKISAAKWIEEQHERETKLWMWKAQKKDIENIDEPTPFTFTAQPYLKYQLDSIFTSGAILNQPAFTLGLAAGYDLIGPTERAILLAEDKLPGFFKASLGAESTLFWGADYRWSLGGAAQLDIGTSFSSAQSDYLLNATLDLTLRRYFKSFDLGLGFKLNYFDDPGNKRSLGSISFVLVSGLEKPQAPARTPVLFPVSEELPPAQPVKKPEVKEKEEKTPASITQSAPQPPVLEGIEIIGTTNSASLKLPKLVTIDEIGYKPYSYLVTVESIMKTSPFDNSPLVQVTGTILKRAGVIDFKYSIKDLKPGESYRVWVKVKDNSNNMESKPVSKDFTMAAKPRKPMTPAECDKKGGTWVPITRKCHIR